MVRGWDLRAVALIVLWSGCEPGERSLLVDVRTDFVPGVEFAYVATRLSRGGVPLEHPPALATLGTDFADGRRVAEFHGLVPDTWVVEVELRDLSERLVAHRAWLVDVTESRVTTVSLGRSCRDVECPSSTDPSATECSNGVCVPPCGLDGESLCPARCSDAETCPQPMASCAVATCSDEGECLLVPVEACGEGAYCDPDLGCQDLGCVPEPEVCDGADQNCNGLVDDGACGPHQACGPAGCACDEGWLDCVDGPDGCETPENAENCGRCGNACDAGQPICEPIGDTCVDGCGAGLELCGTVCARTADDPSHCGGCSRECPSDNGTPSCAGGECRIACDPGYGDCDPAGPGCEQPLTTLAHCGGCGVACSRANASASCATGTCRLTTCDAGWGNCDGNEANGCETALTTLSDCGECGEACARDHAGESCATGACVLGDCEGGWGNCDGEAANGCEQPLNTAAHCGACGAPCAFANADSSCATGTCVMGACDRGWGDCDGLRDNGCERSLSTTSNCGACGASCATNESCQSDLLCHCGTDAAGPGGSGASVCMDTHANTDRERCQGSFPRRCTVVACDPGWMDCDGAGWNGCEAMTCP